MILSKAIAVCKRAKKADKHRQTMNMSSQVAEGVNTILKPKCHPPYTKSQQSSSVGKCLGHTQFASMCKATRNAKINNSESSDSKSEPCLGEHYPRFQINMIVLKTLVLFLIDSGASVNVLPKKFVKTLLHSSSFGSST